MSKAKKTPTKTVSAKKQKSESTAGSHRKNTTATTRAAGRQRSGNNDPQHGSH